MSGRLASRSRTHLMPACPRAENSAYSDQVRGDHADRDQRVHRRRAVPEVDHGGAVERPGAPHHDRGGQHEGSPLPVRELQRRDHRQHHHRDGQRERDQQPPQRIRLPGAVLLHPVWLCEAGRTAEYPACSTTEIRSPALTAAGKLTRAVSVAKLTVAVTPCSLLSFFSTRAAHEAHVIPPIARSTRPAGPPGIAAGISPMTALTRITPFRALGRVPGSFGRKRSSGRTAVVPAPTDLSRNRAWPPGRVLSGRRADSRRPRPAPRPPPARSAAPHW